MRREMMHPRIPLAHGARPYYSGIFDNQGSNTNILLLSGVDEIGCIKQTRYIPSTPITDPSTQIMVGALMGRETLQLEEKNLAYVQDSPVARQVLEDGGFKPERLDLVVIPDPNFEY